MIIGDYLEQLCRSTTKTLWLVAPFIKQATLRRLLGHVSSTVEMNCVTRWRPEEIQGGVSDLDVWLLLRERPNSTLWLRADLHAKYYRGDQQALIGSANLTNTALGWMPRPNLELLMEAEPLFDFEELLIAGSIKVDDSLYDHVKQLVSQLPATEKVPLGLGDSLDDEVVAYGLSAWLPLSRHPENLYLAYKGDWEKLSTGSRIAAISDLRELDIPSGLNREQFEAYVGVQLLQKAIVRQVDNFVEKPQRFGAVRDFLKTLPCASQQDFDADMAWQTLMRWMVYFVPNRYKVSTPRHSEIFERLS